MESLAAAYFEETFEQLNECEVCLSELKKTYSKDQMDQFFRSVHSIKGSSAAMGYEEVQDLAHKLEDVWDAVRREDLLLDESIVDLSYESVDTIYKMVENRKNPSLEADNISSIIKLSRGLKEQLKQTLDKKEFESLPAREELPEEKETAVEVQPEKVLSADEVHSYKNRYFIHLVMDTGNPMPAVTRFLVHKNLAEKGSIDYSAPDTSAIIAMEDMTEGNEMEILYRSSLDRVEIQREIDLGYIKDFFVFDLSEAYQAHALTIADKEFFFMYFAEMAKIFYDMDNRKSAKMDNDFWTKIEYNLVRIHSQAILLEDHSYYRSWKDGLTTLKEMIQSEDCKIFRNSETAFMMIKEMLIQLLYDAYRLTNNETFLRRHRVKENQNIILTFQNKAMELDEQRYKLYLIDISRLNQLRQDEIMTLDKVDRELKEKGITLFLVNDGKMKKRIHTGGAYLPITRKIIFYENERDMIHKVCKAWVVEQNTVEEVDDENIDS
ncbi:MAG: hypothetical protein D5S00_00205 [Tindallia sp. MSAO_Bac2]|nr:MAG: hypothetical protein D5S00_00205 [Tindallia sp. MSAO_Bac2]